MKTAQVYSTLKYAQVSPRKVAPVLDLFRGMDIESAQTVLKFDTTKGAAFALKVLSTATADAIHNHKMDKNKLYVAETWVDGGPVKKYGVIAGRGRYNIHKKRTSHIVIGLSERKG